MNKMSFIIPVIVFLIVFSVYLYVCINRRQKASLFKTICIILASIIGYFSGAIFGMAVFLFLGTISKIIHGSPLGMGWMLVAIAYFGTSDIFRFIFSVLLAILALLGIISDKWRIKSTIIILILAAVIALIYIIPVIFEVTQ